MPVNGDNSRYWGRGSKGSSHLGVIRRLEPEDFRIKAVAGISFGGLVAIFNPAQTWEIPLLENLPLRLIARVGKMRDGQALDFFLRSFDIVTHVVTEYRLAVDIRM